MVDPAIIMALMRSLHLAAMVSLLGTAGFLAWVLPVAGTPPDTLRHRLTRLGGISGALALLAGLGWSVLQSAAIAGAENASEILASLPLVAGHTRFGTALTLRLALLLIATLAAIVALPRPVPGSGTASLRQEGTPAGTTLETARSFAVYVVVVFVAIALGLQGIIGHSGAAAGAIGDGLVLSEFLHLVAASLWLGALLPLWLSLRALPPAVAKSVCERFSPIALGCTVVLAGTGFAQALQLIGSLPALLGTPYGHIAHLKIGLFVLALVLAAINRLWLTDRLTAVTTARRLLLVSVFIETVIGLAAITAAGFLASTVPGAHEAPVWPFTWQFSLVTVRADPGFRQEVYVSLLAIGLAALLTVAALLRRRFRLSALIILLAVIAWRGPSLSLLTVGAYPTSFQTSPSGFSASSIAHGQALFMQNCAACHGPEGEGDGPAAAALRVRPADLTQPHIFDHTDGEMFWWLTHGIDDPEGGLAMPGFAGALSADDRWALIDFVRAHNAGVMAQQDSTYDAPVRAPSLPIACDAMTASTMGDLRGHAVLVIVGGMAEDRQVVPSQDAVTLVVSANDKRPAPGGCVAADPAAWNAYAVLADLPLDEAADAEFLIDPNGWMRAVRRPGTTGGWNSRNELLAAIRAICIHPIEQPSGSPHGHHH
jgi:putative copper export protein/mono/diheme cytochrome c family protein